MGLWCEFLFIAELMCVPTLDYVNGQHLAIELA